MDKMMIKLPEIAIIGKLGFCTKEKNIANDLWHQATTHFSEVSPIGMKEQNGSFVGFWGAMSDESMAFLPWTDAYSRGYYLAGIEVYKDAIVPDGWTKWIMPSRTYLKVFVVKDQYEETFHNCIQTTMPAMNLKLCGAVCDYIEPATGNKYLLFPVKNL